MPPSKKATAPTAAQPTEEHLVASLSRSNLESLLISHLRKGTISSAEVETLITPTLKIVVDRGVQREGTGFFDELEDSLLISIILSLTFGERLAAATCICKSWRFLRDIPELWNAVKIRDPGHAYAWQQNLALTDHLPIWGVHLDRLTAFVHASAVTSLSIHTGEGTRIGVKEVERSIKALPSLRSISLFGKAIKSSVLQTLVKHAATPSLTSIELGEPIHGSSKDIRSFLTRAIKLETLRVPAKLMDDGLLLEMHRTWSEQRGGPPLLSTLRVDGNHPVSLLPEMPSLAKWFPELSSLTLAMNGYGQVRMQWETLATIPAFPTGVSFWRLRHLLLDDGATYDSVLTTVQVGALLSAVLPATPVLESFHLIMREPYSKNCPPPPSLGGSLKHLPASITHIELSDVCVVHPLFHPLTHELSNCIDLSNLEKLTLHNCSGYPFELAGAVRETHPRVETLVTSWKHGRRPMKAVDAEKGIMSHIKGGKEVMHAPASSPGVEPEDDTDDDDGYVAQAAKKTKVAMPGDDD